MSHTAFTTVPPPGPETKPVEPMGRHRDQNTCKLTFVFERRKKKGREEKKAVQMGHGSDHRSPVQFSFKEGSGMFRSAARKCIAPALSLFPLEERQACSCACLYNFLKNEGLREALMPPVTLNLSLRLEYQGPEVKRGLERQRHALGGRLLREVPYALVSFPKFQNAALF